jgi:uncharacterized membrane protein
MSNVQSRLEAISQNGYNFRLGDYISQGFSIFGKNAGLFIGYLIVYFMISIVLALIPLLGSIGSFLISGALVAGFFIVAEKTDKGDYVSFSNFFDGFKDWANLFVVILLSGLFTVFALIPAFTYIIMAVGLENLASLITTPDIDNNPFSDLTAINILIFFVLMFAGMLVGILFIYAPMFVVLERMQIWESMVASAKIVSKNIFMHLLFFIVWIFIFLISIIPLGLGLLATIPAFQCSLYAAWKQITGYGQIEKDEDELLNHLID